MMQRPEHDDFWLISEVLIDLDQAAEDVGLDRTLDVDMPSVAYAALQRALRMRGHLETDEHGFAVAWIDGFAAGINFQKRRKNNL